MKYKNKYVYIEWLRVAAIFFVIFNHTNDIGFFLFSKYPTGSFMWIFYLMISICCKFSVPAFLAISGVLLLNKEESLKDIYKKRVSIIVFVLIIFSVFYYIYYQQYSVDFSFSNFFLKLYTGGIEGLFWYLYLYIGFLIQLPFLRAIVKVLDKKMYEYLFVITFVISGLINIIEFFALDWESLEGSLKNLWVCSSTFVYPLLGYYIHNLIEVTPKLLCRTWILNLSCIGFSIYATYEKAILDGYVNESISQTFFNNFVIVNVFAIFCLVKYLIDNHKKLGKLNKVICALGDNVFGIYLIHILILRPMVWNPEALWFSGFGPLSSAFLICLTCFVKSFVIVYILRIIPMVKKLL